MSMTQEKAEKIVEVLRLTNNDYILNQDAVGVASCYHSDAVLIHGGEDVPIVGRNAIQKAYEKYLVAKPEFVDKTVYVSYSVDGKFLMSRGEYEVTGQRNYTGKNTYERIYQQQPDGKYVVYYQRRGEYKKQ